MSVGRPAATDPKSESPSDGFRFPIQCSAEPPDGSIWSQFRAEVRGINSPTDEVHLPDAETGDDDC